VVERAGFDGGPDGAGQCREPRHIVLGASGFDGLKLGRLISNQGVDTQAGRQFAGLGLKQPGVGFELQVEVHVGLRV
jgi:hypothetical protein